MDKTQEKMNKVLDKVGSLLKTNDTGTIYTIMTLSCVLCVLVLIILVF